MVHMHLVNYINLAGDSACMRIRLRQEMVHTYSHMDMRHGAGRSPPAAALD